MDTLKPASQYDIDSGPNEVFIDFRKHKETGSLIVKLKDIRKQSGEW